MVCSKYISTLHYIALLQTSTLNSCMKGNSSVTDSGATTLDSGMGLEAGRAAAASAATYCLQVQSLLQPGLPAFYLTPATSPDFNLAGVAAARHLPHC
jgi:hypothetical protein